MPPTATTAPVVQAPPTQPPAAPAGPTTFNVTAKGLQFSTAFLTARSGATVTVNFTNADNNVPHDLSFDGPGLPQGTTCRGPCSDSYSFVAPAPGNYRFFCSLHVDMAGTFSVTP